MSRAEASAALESLADADVMAAIPGSKGSLGLVKGHGAFVKAYFICDRAGRPADLLRTPYAQERIGEDLLSGATEHLVHAAVLAVLRLLSSSLRQVRDDPFLDELSRMLGESPGADESLMRIQGSLLESGFEDFLAFSLQGAGEEDRAAERQELIEGMAEKDMRLFFGQDPPLPSLRTAFEALIFPESERPEILGLARSSPSALRLLLVSERSRLGPLAAAAVLQTLPLLEELFIVFRDWTPGRCQKSEREEVDSRLLEMARREGQGPGPSPLLSTLRARTAAEAG